MMGRLQFADVFFVARAKAFTGPEGSWRVRLTNEIHDANKNAYSAPRPELHLTCAHPPTHHWESGAGTEQRGGGPRAGSWVAQVARFGVARLTCLLFCEVTRMFKHVGSLHIASL
jgi:hypothetical protein